MGVKEERERMFADLSPLRHHSLNQASIKKSLHGERVMHHVLGEPLEQPVAEVALDTEILDQELPLSRTFLNVCLEKIVDTAKRRETTPEDSLTIPIRTFNMLADVGQIFKFAIEQGVGEVILDRPITDRVFHTRLDFLRHRGLISRANLLVTLGNHSGWRSLDKASQADLFSNFYKAFEINLGSLDFGLLPEERAAERAQTYGYLLSNLGKLYYSTYDDTSVKPIPVLVIEGVQKNLRLKK